MVCHVGPFRRAWPVVHSHAEMTHGYAQANGVRLHYVEQGSGPLVILLHGFPDFWYCWRHQIPALAAAGYRVVAPDLRGYNESERPQGVVAYGLDTLASDVAALIQALGAERATVVGHDWGGLVAWHVAMHHPEVVSSLVIMNAPHPRAFRRELTHNWAQKRRSWYIGLFQLPWLPEVLFAVGNRWLLRRVLRRGGPAHSDAELATYLAAFAGQGAMTAALHYYRALVRVPMRRPVTIECPTLLIWGLRDPFLLPALTEGTEAWVTTLERHDEPTARHWVQHDAAASVNARLLAFLSVTAAG